jgi:hypothetical protein
MQQFLPSSIDGWTVLEPGRLYSGREIFEYMDGAGEVYLAYNFDSLLVQRYSRAGQEEILVEIFDMGLPRNAFGVFTYMLGRGPAVPIGQDGEYKSGLLCFWKDRYCVYIRIEEENDQAKGAVLEIGRRIAAAIATEGRKPILLQCLPGGTYVPESLRYFYRNEILNTHFYVADGNLFLLDDRTEALLVRMKADRSHALVVGYPDDGHADSAYRSVLVHLMHDAGREEVVKMENGKWTACTKQDTYVIAVFDALTKQDAMNTISQFRRRLP